MVFCLGLTERMRRRLLNLLTAVSLLLCAAAVLAWVRGHRVADGIVVRRARYRPAGPNDKDRVEAPYRGKVTLASVRSAEGNIWFWLERSVDLQLGPEYARTWGEQYPAGTHVTWHRDRAPFFDGYPLGSNVTNERTWFDRFGFACVTADRPGLFVASVDFHLTMASVPAWFLAVLFGLLPAARAWRWTRRRGRRADGTCRRCGYDLTGNVSGVCPECGEAVPRGS